MPLPPGLTEREFESALVAMRTAVGDEWVISSQAGLESYRDPFSPLLNPPEEPLAPAAIAPANVEQVQQVLRIASDHGLTLWPISTGKNFGYGGPAPGIPGTLVLDLKRMNRVLEVNEKHAYCRVEPGVSYFDLYRYIRERDIKLWLDTPEPGWGGIVGNMLERGTGYTPYADKMETQCGMEVVLPTGDLVRTGMGALPGSETWAQYKWGFGPLLDGLFSQASLGVVTKMGMYLMEEPAAFFAGGIEVAKREDIIPMINIMRGLWKKRIVQVYANIRPMFIMAMESGMESTEGWYYRVGLYGDKKILERQWEIIQDAFSVIPGVKMDGKLYEQPYAVEGWNRDVRLLAGIPYLRGNYGVTHNVYLSQVIPFEGEAYYELLQMADTLSQKYGRRYVGTPIHTHSWGGMVTTVSLRVSKDDQKMSRDSVDLGHEILHTAAEMGMGVYRVSPVFMEAASTLYSFNDNALMKTNNLLKDALDPGGILQPGKNGVWPKRLRGQQA
jgi:FAD/FMN-containing dehydrogenase